MGWGEAPGWGGLEETLETVASHRATASSTLRPQVYLTSSGLYFSWFSPHPLLSFTALYLPLHIRHGLPWCHQGCHSPSTGNHFSLVPHTFLVFSATPPPNTTQLSRTVLPQQLHGPRPHSRQNCSLALPRQ